MKCPVPKPRRLDYQRFNAKLPASGSGTQSRVPGGTTCGCTTRSQRTSNTLLHIQYEIYNILNFLYFIKYFSKENTYINAKKKVFKIFTEYYGSTDQNMNYVFIYGITKLNFEYTTLQYIRLFSKYQKKKIHL